MLPDKELSVSRRIFASAFTVAPLPANEEVSFRYDSKRSLNLDDSGEPWVNRAKSSRTGTVTEVRGEASDRDRADEARASLDTITKVRGEASDRAPMLATDTRIRRECSSDQNADGTQASAGSLLGTQTAGPGEPSDPPRGRGDIPVRAPSARPVRRVRC